MITTRNNELISKLSSCKKKMKIRLGFKNIRELSSVCQPDRTLSLFAACMRVE